MLATLLEHGEISQAQHDKTLGDLTEKKASIMYMSFSDSDGGFECTRFELNDVALPTMD